MHIFLLIPFEIDFFDQLTCHIPADQAAETNRMGGGLDFFRGHTFSTYVSQVESGYGLKFCSLLFFFKPHN